MTHSRNSFSGTVASQHQQEGPGERAAPRLSRAAAAGGLAHTHAGRRPLGPGSEQAGLVAAGTTRERLLTQTTFGFKEGGYLLEMCFPMAVQGPPLKAELRSAGQVNLVDLGL